MQPSLRRAISRFTAFFFISGALAWGQGIIRGTITDPLGRSC